MEYKRLVGDIIGSIVGIISVVVIYWGYNIVGSIVVNIKYKSMKY